MLTESYYHDTRYPLSPYTLPQLWEKSAQRDTENYVLWVDPYEKLTHKEAYDQAMLIAKGLLTLGLKRGDTLCCFGSQGSDPVLMFIACSSLGIKIMSNYVYSPAEKVLKMVINKAKPTAVLIGDAKLFVETVSTKAADVINELTDDEDGHTVTHVLYDRKLEKDANFSRPENWRSLSGVMESGRGDKISDEMLSSAKALVEKNEPCFFECSSGSTGEPKLVLLGAGLFTNIPTDLSIGFGNQIEVVGMPDMAAEALALVTQIIGDFANNMNLVVFPVANTTDDSAIIESLLNAIARYKVELFYYDQYFTTQIVNNPECRTGHDLSSVKCMVTAGSLSTQEFKLKMLGIAPLSMDVYGCTEFIRTVIPSLGSLKTRPTSVGQVVPNVEAKIVDDDGAIVPVNTRGQLCLRGWPLFLEYKDQPELTAKATDEDGWYLTGDMVSMDELGYLYVYGRIATAQRWKVDGDVVYSISIETVLRTHPKISANMVVGTQGEGTSGHELNYVIVPVSDSDLQPKDVRQFAVEKMGSCVEWPVRIFFYSFKDLPRTSGARRKVDRIKLQEMIAARVAADSRDGVVWENTGSDIFNEVVIKSKNY